MEISKLKEEVLRRLVEMAKDISPKWYLETWFDSDVYVDASLPNPLAELEEEELADLKNDYIFAICGDYAYNICVEDMNLDLEKDKKTIEDLSEFIHDTLQAYFFSKHMGRYIAGLTSDAYEEPYDVYDIVEDKIYVLEDGTVPLFDTEEEAEEYISKNFGYYLTWDIV